MANPNTFFQFFAKNCQVTVKSIFLEQKNKRNERKTKDTKAVSYATQQNNKYIQVLRNNIIFPFYFQQTLFSSYNLLILGKTQDDTLDTRQNMSNLSILRTLFDFHVRQDYLPLNIEAKKGESQFFLKYDHRLRNSMIFVYYF